MHQKRYKRIRWFCGLAVLISLCVLLIFANRHVTIQPFKDLKREEIKRIQVVDGRYGVLHDMTEVEIEEFVDILLRITHNEYAREFEIPMGGNLSNGFVSFMMEEPYPLEEWKLGTMVVTSSLI